MARKRLEHVGIMVRDIEASAAFYEKVVGLSLKGTLLHTNGVIRLAFLGFGEAAETELELIQGYNEGLPQEGKVHHVAFAVDGIEEEFTRVQEMGVHMIDESITTLPNGSRYFFFHGLDGEWIEFFESTRA